MEKSLPAVFATLLGNFGVVQRILLFTGFAVLLVGIPFGLTLGNRTVMIGGAIMAMALLDYYASDIRSHELITNDPASRVTEWGNAFRAFLCLVALILACWFFYQGR